MTINRSSVKLFAVFVLLLGQSGGLAGQTLKLNFEPPDIEIPPVCVARSFDAELISEWRAWDGQTLPDRDVGLINRDMRRLAELDPVAWNSTIEKVISLLPSVSPSFTEDYVMLARIEHFIALGQLQELRTEGLVQKLIDRGDENSPRMLNALAGFLNEGIGIDRDTARGAEFLMASGYGGNADALLTLSRLAVEGKAPKDWDINPQLAMTMAFGSLVGQIDPLICDRIARIAREFSNGEVVSVDHDLAVRWYRFAADLGDPISAWRVAEYELQSELVTKDNDILITYLTKAADGNLPYAQVALGRVYEAGALVPIDTAKAQALYEEASKSGDRAGLIRLSGFLEAQLLDRPELEDAFLDTLDQLGQLPDAPAWVFAKQAAQVMSVEGRWAGQATARVLLEQGAAMGDPAAITMLAQMDFGDAKTDADFYVAVDHLVQVVTTLGEAAPTADLQAAFLCKAPKAPLLTEAAYWERAESAIGSSSVQFSDGALEQLAKNRDPLAMAALQTQALYGRATPLANLLAVLELSGAPRSEVEFWTSYADQFPNVASARAALALEQAANSSAREVALDDFRAAVLAGDTSAPLKLAKALLTDDTETARTEAVALLSPLAEQGNGEAMALLLDADPATYPTALAIFDAYETRIEERGDFQALILALPFLTKGVDRETYLARAITAMECVFPEALALAQAMVAEGNLDEARRWLSIATHLAGQDSWQIVQLADSYQALLDTAGDATALALYERAYALGNRTAVQRLLRLQGNPAKGGYNQARAVTLYIDLVALSDPGQVPAVLDELARKDPAIRLAVEARLNLDLLYSKAAESGNLAAMREHSRRLQASAATRDDLVASTGWLIRASEGGDPAAMVMLSQAYSLGVGVPASLETAQTWLVKAAKAGDLTAIEMVKLFAVNAGTN